MNSSPGFFLLHLTVCSSAYLAHLTSLTVSWLSPPNFLESGDPVLDCYIHWLEPSLLPCPWTWLLMFALWLHLGERYIPSIYPHIPWPSGSWEPFTWPRLSGVRKQPRCQTCSILGTSKCHHLEKGDSYPVSLHCLLWLAAPTASTPVCPHSWQRKSQSLSTALTHSMSWEATVLWGPASLTPGKIQPAACSGWKYLVGCQAVGLRTPAA